YINSGVGSGNGGVTPAIPGHIILNTGGGNGAGTVQIKIGNVEKVRVNEAGNVGVGTTTPAAKLDVNGNIAIAGTPVIDANRNWVGNPTVPVGPGGTPLNPLQVALLKWAPYSDVSFSTGNTPYGVAFDGANLW